MIKMRNKNKLILAWIAIILLLMATASSSVESLPNVNESNQFLNNTKIQRVNASLIFIEIDLFILQCPDEALYECIIVGVAPR